MKRALWLLLLAGCASSAAPEPDHYAVTGAFDAAPDQVSLDGWLEVDGGVRGDVVIRGTGAFAVASGRVSGDSITFASGQPGQPYHWTFRGRRAGDGWTGVHAIVNLSADTLTGTWTATYLPD